MKRDRRIWPLVAAFAGLCLVLTACDRAIAAPEAPTGQESTLSAPDSETPSGEGAHTPGRNRGYTWVVLAAFLCAFLYGALQWLMGRKRDTSKDQSAQQQRSALAESGIEFPQASKQPEGEFLTPVAEFETPRPTEASSAGAVEPPQALERLQKLNQLKEALLAPGRLEEKLRTITDSLAELFDVDFCRIWLVRPGDMCDKGCIHATYKDGPHACRNRERCLHLKASSGRHARVDSKMHQRVPFGCYKIGRVGAGQQRKFLTNDIANDRRVPNPKWASQLGLVSFAGYKLVSPAGKPMGVLAFFANHAISPEEDAMLESVANSISAALQTAQAEEALRESEEKFRALYESSSDAVMLFDGGILFDCNESALRVFGYDSREAFLGKHFSELSPPTQKTGQGAPLADSAVLANEQFERAITAGSNRFEWVHTKADGAEFIADVLLTAMEVHGKVLLQAVVRDITERKQAEQDRERLIAKLKEALSKIRTLSGLLPICASCKKIRDDSGYWNQIEVYVSEHSDAEFSHSICPECKKKLYPELYDK